MNHITLDFTGIKTLWNLHEYFKSVFDLPDYYGHNMDALWDCLHCYYDKPTVIELKCVNELPKEMKEAKETIISLFLELERRNAEITITIHDDKADNSEYLA